MNDDIQLPDITVESIAELLKWPIETAQLFIDLNIHNGMIIQVGENRYQIVSEKAIELAKGIIIILKQQINEGGGHEY